MFERAHEQLRRALDAQPDAVPTTTRAPDAVPPRRLRLDAELVRRGLARSREHASELIAAGRVTVAGARATKPATGVTTDVAIVVADDPTTGPTTSPAAGTSWPGRWRRSSRHGLASPGGAAWTPGRRPAASPTCCCARARARWWRSTSATASSPGRCSSDERVQVHDRTNIRELTLEHRSAGRSTWWWATCPSSPSRWCSTPLLS